MSREGFERRRPGADDGRRDWTLGKYTTLLENALEAGYTPCRIDRYLETRPDGGRWLLLRHDVDRRPGNALAMAALERDLGVAATYYVRNTAGRFDDALVTQLAAWGHEIGYHYEVLAKTRGDVGAAIELFRGELAQLRDLAQVRTATAHGSPLSPWNSLDIWARASPADFGLLGEAYLELDYATVGYYTDTGRSWAADGANLRDRVDTGSATFPRVDTTDALIELLAGGTVALVCVQTHPERWNQGLAAETRQLVIDSCTNAAKRVIRSLRGAGAR